MLKKINAMAEFNRWCGIEVTVAEAGVVEIQMPWRPELGQYSGYLHAGLIGTLIDTACGFAAGTVAGPNLLAANFSVNCLRPAVGQKFIARAQVVKQGKAQVFTSCDLFAVDAEGEKTGGQWADFAYGGCRVTHAVCECPRVTIAFKGLKKLQYLSNILNKCAPCESSVIPKPATV
jgi:uncharacterized protein (TIGR00369 family)